MRLAVHAAGEGPPVVLLHGLFGSARNLGGLQRALADQFRVVSLDLRNHGDSPHDPAMDYATMAADVTETLDAEGVLPAAILGHSMGGKVAMTLALQAPDSVRRLVVADIAPVTYPSHFGAYVAAMLPVPPEFSRAQADAALLDAIPDKAIRSFLLHNFRSGAGWRVGLAEIAASLPRIESWGDDGTQPYAGPALFVTGARSDYVQEKDRPAIRALFPTARFVAIRDAGHWLHAEQPAAFNATVAAFLKPLLSGDGR
jgi:pimeloyl-ACP methyl ester carboxylesterase